MLLEETLMKSLFVFPSLSSFMCFSELTQADVLTGNNSAFLKPFFFLQTEVFIGRRLVGTNMLQDVTNVVICLKQTCTLLTYSV